MPVYDISEVLTGRGEGARGSSDHSSNIKTLVEQLTIWEMPVKRRDRMKFALLKPETYGTELLEFTRCWDSGLRY